MSSLKWYIKWLHKAKVYGWRKSEDCDEDLFRFRHQDLLTIEEKSNVRTIPIWTPQELTTLWKYATTWQRSLLLLGLNCGFAAAECTSLRLNEVHFAEHRVKRIRIKSGIYGEFAVWPETEAALCWLIAQAERAGNLKADGIILPDLDYKGVTKVWKRLIGRVRKDHSPTATTAPPKNPSCSVVHRATTWPQRGPLGARETDDLLLPHESLLAHSGKRIE